MIIFGLPAFQGYYTVHDNRRSRLGIVPHTASAKAFVRTDAIERFGTINTGRYGGPPMWVPILIVVIIFGGAAYFFGWHWMDYCKTWFPNNLWIQYELWTAYWFGIIMLAVLVRVLFNL